MNITQVKKYSRALNIQLHSTPSKGWASASCPLAPYTHDKGKRDENPSFGIRVRSGRPSNCHCFGCGFAGDMMELVLELRSYDKTNLDFKTALRIAEEDEEGGGLEIAYADDTAAEKEQKDSVEYFDEEWLSSFPSYKKSKDAVSYCESRMPRWVADKLDLRYDPVERRVCFPVRDAAGYLVGLHGRSIEKKPSLKYRMYQSKHPRGGKNNPIFWYGEEWIDWDSKVVIVESVFDLAAVYPVYQNVICPLTAEVPVRKIQRIQDALSLVIIPDGDKAGKKLAYKIKDNLRKTPIKIIYLQDGQDPGDLSFAEISSLLKPHLKNFLTD